LRYHHRVGNTIFFISSLILHIDLVPEPETHDYGCYQPSEGLKIGRLPVS
jgi:hypothetical protein